jgi:hypothetical protein
MHQREGIKEVLPRKAFVMGTWRILDGLLDEMTDCERHNHNQSSYRGGNIASEYFRD